MRPSITVQCYSGYKGDQRPIRFSLHGVDYFVDEILDQWRGPDAMFFEVRASGTVRPGDVPKEGIFLLRQSTSYAEGEWRLESSRHSGLWN
jgi:hypothetical protein